MGGGGGRGVLAGGWGGWGLSKRLVTRPHTQYTAAQMAWGMHRSNYDAQTGHHAPKLCPANRQGTFCQITSGEKRRKAGYLDPICETRQPKQRYSAIEYYDVHHIVCGGDLWSWLRLRLRLRAGICTQGREPLERGVWRKATKGKWNSRRDARPKAEDKPPFPPCPSSAK